MLRTTKNMKDRYEKMQTYIFSLIPEKWDEIYLYASIVDEKNSNNKGELFFYYLPKGLLKKKPINVYEVPNRFNINEEKYLKIVEELYICIKDLAQDFKNTEQDLWTNITISIANFKFKVEFNYDELPFTEKEIYERNVIWKYKYLKIGGESKEEREILDNYYMKMSPTRKEVYETGLYLKTENSKITFDKEQPGKPVQFVIYEKDDIANIINKTKNRFHNGISFNKNKDTKSSIESDENEETQSKNQILNN